MRVTGYIAAVRMSAVVGEEEAAAGGGGGGGGSGGDSGGERGGGELGRFSETGVEAIDSQCWSIRGDGVEGSPREGGKGENRREKKRGGGRWREERDRIADRENLTTGPATSGVAQPRRRGAAARSPVAVVSRTVHSHLHLHVLLHISPSKAPFTINCSTSFAQTILHAYSHVLRSLFASNAASE